MSSHQRDDGRVKGRGARRPQPSSPARGRGGRASERPWSEAEARKIPEPPFRAPFFDATSRAGRSLLFFGRLCPSASSGARRPLFPHALFSARFDPTPADPGPMETRFSIRPGRVGGAAGDRLSLSRRDFDSRGQRYAAARFYRAPKPRGLARVSPSVIYSPGRGIESAINFLRVRERRRRRADGIRREAARRIFLKRRGELPGKIGHCWHPAGQPERDAARGRVPGASREDPAQKPIIRGLLLCDCYEFPINNK